MPDTKVSFPTWLMHKVDSLLMSKAEAKRINDETLAGLRADEEAKKARDAESEKAKTWKPKPETELDPLAQEIEKERKKKVYFSKFSPDALKKK